MYAICLITMGYMSKKEIYKRTSLRPAAISIEWWTSELIYHVKRYSVEKHSCLNLIWILEWRDIGGGKHMTDMTSTCV